MKNSQSSTIIIAGFTLLFIVVGISYQFYDSLKDIGLADIITKEVEKRNAEVDKRIEDVKKQKLREERECRCKEYDKKPKGDVEQKRQKD